MIIKNGEILAIDHIAHDNTLSGNGTSAKPVGLSQSTKDLIDSKVKKTDFETYKSSAANQISNINTKITTDESNFESYKSSAHDEIARIDSSIAAVNAAKVDKTTFTQYQTDVANNFTAVNKRIDDVDAAKQNKGDYVSASDFNSYKSSAHNEIARVDEKIDTTSDNLRDNYYKTSETYNRTEVDEKFANFGGFKFRDPDPTKDNEPKLAPGEVIDPKAIYLTQPAGATQYLQWIWNTEVTPNVWKCIGDTTMDLSDYAKTVDVVASANNNVQAVKDWADDKFETKQNFESVIAGYYTKDDTDGLLNTKVDKTTFEAYQQTVSNAFDSVDRDFENTSAWANNTFATKTDLNDVQTDLETEISNLSTNIESDIADVSGKIINELNDVESALNNKINNVDTKLDTVSGELVGKIETVEETLSAKIDTVDKNVDDLKTELETEYYDADTIEDILAASGDYYDKGEINSLLDNYVKTEELEPINEKIESVSAEFNKYYTKSDVDNNFTTKDTFDNTITEINNDLGDIVETVSAIDQDKADKSDLNDYYKTSETSGKDELSAEFAKYTKTEDLHIPTTVAELTDSSNYYTTAETSGKNELSAAFDAILKYNVTAAAGIEVTTATDDGVKTFGISMTAEPVVTDTTLSGYNGIAATRDATISNQWNVGLTHDMLNTINGKLDSSDAAQTYLTKTDAANTYQKIGNYLENTDIELDANNKITGISGKELVITAHQSLANYYTKSEVDTALNDKVDTSELETVSGEIVNKIPSLDGYATQSWVEGKNYLKADDIAGKADKTDLQYVSAGVDYVSGHIPAKVTDLTDSANYYTINQTSAASELTTEFAKYALKSDIPTKVTDLTDSADYAKKTDLDGFVTKDGITTQGADYVMTTTGWKVLSLPGGGMTQVIHDTTLTGQGNADNDKLGVAWSALSGNTIASALSAGSATVAANLGTSSFADITGAINAKADATAISDMLTKTEATSTYQTKAGMSDYLTTAQYNTDSATYVTSGNEISAANEQYALTTTGWTKIATPATFTGVTTTGSISGGGVNNDTIGLLTSAENALKDVANKVAKPDTTQTELNNNYLIYSTLTDPAATTGWMPLSANYYSKSEADGRYQKKEDMSSYLTTAQYQTDSAKYVLTGDILTAANNALTGIKIGSTDYIIPNDYAKQTGNYQNLSAGSATSAYSAYSASYATTAASAYIDSNTTSAMSDIVDELHGKLDSTAAEATYLPLTGGTVTGQTTISGSAFDTFELKRSDQQGSTGIIGINGAGGMSFKIVNGNNNTQLNIAPNATMDKRFSIGDTPHQPAAYFIPAVTATTTAGLTNDGILHIILES
jgi:hypothetical protein